MDLTRFLGEDIVQLLQTLDDEEAKLKEFIEENLASSNVSRNRMYDRPYAGHVYVAEIMIGHEQRAYNFFRMPARAFQRLVNLLTERDLISDTKNMPATEQVAILMRVLAQADSYRSVCEFFQHSLETVSRNFHHVLKAILTLAPDIIVPPSETITCSPHIRHNQNFYPYFKDAIGALDGTHVPAIVSRHKQNRYRNRKNFVSQNVLGAVNFERQFVYVASGWEGSAADMRVLRWAVEQDRFNVPRGKYFLVDSGYANTDKFIAPIRGFRYHLSEYRTPQQRRYDNAQELYNHRHAQLRNVVERTFGILKARFKVLTDMKAFTFSIQADIVLACCVLHNFIGKHCDDDIYFNMTTQELPPDDNDDEPLRQDSNNACIGIGDKFAGDYIRTTIMQQIWAAQEQHRRL